MTQTSISITILQQTLDEKTAQRRALDEEIDDLERSIRHLRGGASRAEQAPLVIVDSETAPTFVSAQEQAVESDEDYPAQRFRGKKRIQMAIALAKDFDGYVATSAFRKILAKPGVLRSISQVGSVASRVLANSDEFERVWEGLYRLKHYQGEEGMEPFVAE